MADDTMIIQVLRFGTVADTRVPLPQLVEALREVQGFRQGLFLTRAEKDGAVGVLLWDSEQALARGFAALRERLGAQPPHAQMQQYRVAGLEPSVLPAAVFARATTRQFASPAHHAAWRRNVAERIVPALRTLNGFEGVLWGEQSDGTAGFALELWSALPPEADTHTAVSSRPMEDIDASLLGGPALREQFRVAARAPAAAAA